MLRRTLGAEAGVEGYQGEVYRQLAARLLGAMVGDVLQTREEIAGLSQDLLAVDEPPARHRRRSDGVHTHAAEPERHYESKLQRRK